MEHLGYLKVVNFVYAGFMALLALMTLLGGGGATFLELPVFGGGFVLFKILLTVLVTALLAGLSLFYFRVGQEVENGQWRAAQTVLIVFNMFNCPGVLYSAYAVWVCWINVETRDVFETTGATRLPSPGPSAEPTESGDSFPD